MTSLKPQILPIASVPKLSGPWLAHENGGPITATILDGRLITYPIHEEALLGGNLDTAVLNDDRSLHKLEVWFGGPYWRHDQQLEMPTPALWGKVVFDRGESLSCWKRGWVNVERGVIHVEANPEPGQPLVHIQAADKLVVSVTADRTLAGFWLRAPRRITRAIMAHCRSQRKDFIPHATRSTLELHGKGLPPSQTGHVQIGNQWWAAMLLAAYNYGWAPAGTQPPDDWGEKPWNGSYFARSGQTITPEDGAAVVAALERASAAVPDPVPDPFLLPLQRGPEGIPGFAEKQAEGRDILFSARTALYTTENDAPLPDTEFVLAFYHGVFTGQGLLELLRRGEAIIS